MAKRWKSGGKAKTQNPQLSQRHRHVQSLPHIKERQWCGLFRVCLRAVLQTFTFPNLRFRRDGVTKKGDRRRVVRTVQRIRLARRGIDYPQRVRIVLVTANALLRATDRCFMFSSSPMRWSDRFDCTMATEAPPATPIAANDQGMSMSMPRHVLVIARRCLTARLRCHSCCLRLPLSFAGKTENTDVKDGDGKTPEASKSAGKAPEHGMSRLRSIRIGLGADLCLPTRCNRLRTTRTLLDRLPAAAGVGGSGTAAETAAAAMKNSLAGTCNASFVGCGSLRLCATVASCMSFALRRAGAILRRSRTSPAPPRAPGIASRRTRSCRLARHRTIASRGSRAGVNRYCCCTVEFTGNFRCRHNRRRSGQTLATVPRQVCTLR